MDVTEGSEGNEEEGFCRRMQRSGGEEGIRQKNGVKKIGRKADCHERSFPGAADVDVGPRLVRSCASQVFAVHAF